MSTTLLVMTDGRRDCIERTIEAAGERLWGEVAHRIIHDDSGDRDYTTCLRGRFEHWEVVSTPGRSGFGGAIRSAWAHLATLGLADDDKVFHLEDDFVLTRDVDLEQVAWVLDHNPHLVQLALRRQPWNDLEREAGGIVEQHPDAYADCAADTGRYRWLEHRLFFTTNPSMYRASLLAHGWPEGAESEGHFTHRLLTDPKVRFGFWGARSSGEWCEHIGHQRVGVGY